jgi:hypothetical protein
MTPKNLCQCRICIILRVASPSDTRIRPTLHSYVCTSPRSSYFTGLFTLYPISTYILLNHHKDMSSSPPRSSQPTEPAGIVQKRQNPTENDLLAVGGQGLQPSVSSKPLPESSSSPDISPHTQPATSFARPPTHDDHLSIDGLVKLPQTTSANPAYPGPTESFPSPPDELICTMAQYQPVSAGSTASPRTMSQVSPGFIFVNFLSLSVCCFSFPPPLLP